MGGLVGLVMDGNTIRNCYSGCSVIGDDNLGGLVGNQFGTTSVIENCFSYGAVSGHEDIGGLLGKNTGTVTASFWDRSTSGQMSSAGGIGKWTAEMKAKAPFSMAGWDFEGETANGTADVWRMCVDGVDYPRLAGSFRSMEILRVRMGRRSRTCWPLRMTGWNPEWARIPAATPRATGGSIWRIWQSSAPIGSAKGDNIWWNTRSRPVSADLVPPPGELRFSATVEGRYIHFSDPIVANCCADRIQLTSEVSNTTILLHERALMENACNCICTFPTTAVLGPFEPGTYTLKVIQSENYFDYEPYVVGTVSITIE